MADDAERAAKAARAKAMVSPHSVPFQVHLTQVYFMYSSKSGSSRKLEFLPRHHQLLLVQLMYHYQTQPAPPRAPRNTRMLPYSLERLTRVPSILENLPCKSWLRSGM